VKNYVVKAPHGPDYPRMLAVLLGSPGLDIVCIQSDQRDRSLVIPSDAGEVHGVRGLEPAGV
jgi:hypothetical protein